MSEVINETINDRFKKVKDYFGLSVNKFAKMIGVSQPSAKAIIDGDNEPSNKAINGLAIGFPMVNLEWLIRGIGTMLNNCGCSSADDESIYHPSSDGTCNGPGTEEEGRKSESEQARFYKEQAEFYKEQAEFYKQQLDSLKGRQ